MNAVLPDLPVHIAEVHSPDAVFIRFELTVDNLSAQMRQHAGEADVRGGMDVHQRYQQHLPRQVVQDVLHL